MRLDIQSKELLLTSQILNGFYQNLTNMKPIQFCTDGTIFEATSNPFYKSWLNFEKEKQQKKKAKNTSVMPVKFLFHL